jgi:hypothetical protein
MDRFTQDLITRAEHVAALFRGDTEAYTDWAAFQPKAAVRAIEALSPAEFRRLSPDVQELLLPIWQERQAA